MSADFWLDLQKSYELDVARQKTGEELDVIEPYRVSPEPSAAPAIGG